MKSILFKEKFPYQEHYNANNLLGIKNYGNSIVLDLFDALSYIVYTDFYTPRDEDTNNLKKLTVNIPVNNLDLFNNVKDELNKLVKYVTNGENWNINFYKIKTPKFIDNNHLDVDTIKYNSICLLSGGLDSLAGTQFEKSNNTIFVTFQTNSIELNNSSKIYDELIKDVNNVRVEILKKNFKCNSHYTERTRSLMFLASCIIYADYYNINKIKIYENGIMSLNPKFNFSRRVTKTTNQKTLFMFNEILEKLGINILVINPFKYKTKSEVINFIPDNYLMHIKNNTRTCSKNPGIVHFRNKNKGNFHCGVCIACILRQIGIHNNGLDMYDSDYCLPKNLIDLKKIKEYECSISKKNNIDEDLKAAYYKYSEKKSLILYYEQFYNAIMDKSIYNYLDLDKRYYYDDNYLSEIESLLNNFAKELEKYFKTLE